MTVMEMTRKELTRAIAEGLSSVVKEKCDQIDSRVNALAESLSRRLDALEEQAGPVGRRYCKTPDTVHPCCGAPGYTGTISYGTPTIEEYMKAFDRAQPGSGGSDSDSKDALIRDLMGYAVNSHWRADYPKLRDRAEKLGVKL